MSRPPFCPNRSCPCHIDPFSAESATLSDRRWFKRNGSYPTKVRGDVTRFKCLVCGRGFSEQTFSLDYFVKRLINYRGLLRLVSSCVGVRAASRALGCSCDSVSNRTSRLARQSISAHARLLPAIELCEDQAADGFQSFAVSQYFPNNITVLVGSRSQLVSFCDYVTLRRSGRMTVRQRRVRSAFDQLYCPAPKALTESFGELIGHLYRRFRTSSHRPLTLHTDRKPEYQSALAAHPGLCEAAGSAQFLHLTTDSRATRDWLNPLFPVNYLDRQLRKDLAEHVRETVRFARNVNHCMERLWIYLLEHNLRKRFRINDPVGIERRHVTVAGATEADKQRATAGLYTQRRFLCFEALEPAMLRVWGREHHTPLKGIVKGALRMIGRQAGRGEVDLEQIRQQLGVQKLLRDVVQYLPRYALA